MEVKPGYKQTEVGVIPGDWVVRKLTDLLDQSRSIRYGIVQPGEFEPRGSLMLRSQDYSKGWSSPDEMHRVNIQLENQYRNARIRFGDLILTIVGAGIGQVEVAPPWLDGALLSRSTARIAVDEAKAARRFVAACLESPVGKRQILNCQKEGAQPVVSCLDLARFLIPTPPLPEQRSIANALSDADALIESLELLLDKKRYLKQGAMQELLTGKKRLPGFSGEWEVKKVKQFGEIVTGGTPPTGIKEYWNGDIPWVTPTDISDQKDIHASERQITALGLASIRKLPKNSVLITCIASIGKNAVLRNAGACNQQINAIIPNKEHDADFLYYLIDGKKQYLLGNAGITATMIISKRDFSELDFTVPLKAEQTAIAAILSDMDTDLAVLETKLAKARQLKQGMMQELLTGRIRLV